MLINPEIKQTVQFLGNTFTAPYLALEQDIYVGGKYMNQLGVGNQNY